MSARHAPAMWACLASSTGGLPVMMITGAPILRARIAVNSPRPPPPGMFTSLTSSRE